MSDWIEVAKIDDIPPTGLEVQAGEEPVLLVRDGETVRALGALCSHQEMELAGGYIDGDSWVCPHHGASFCLKSGEALSMPAVDPVSTFEVKVEGDRVFVKEPA